MSYQTNLLSLLGNISNTIDNITEWIGRGISWLTLFMVLITFVIVIMRYVFDKGSIALQESVIYLHAFVFMLAASYTLKHDMHVRVDIFYREFTPAKKALVDIIGTVLLLLPVCAFVFSNSLDNVVDAWQRREGSEETGGLDLVYLLKTAMLLMPLLVALQGLSIIAKGIINIKNRGDTNG